MIKRTCGCKNDNINTMRSILNNFRKAKIADDGAVINIGVVFHICFKDYIETTVDDDIQYSIDMLNKDFNKQCSNFDCGSDVYDDSALKQTYTEYVQLADVCNIHFYKHAIIYAPIATQTSSNISVLDRNIKYNSPPIYTDRFLNIWVVDLGGGLLGYAQFPWDNASDTDGVVIAKGTFGKNPSYNEFSLNKTMTHEVGHWLGLYHTFQETFAYDGGNIDYDDSEELQEMKGDCIIDTPPQGNPTYGNPFTTPKTWPSSKPIDESQSYRHMFMNFMDYSDDGALFMFTKDQKSKLRQMIHLYRPAILSNDPSTPETPPSVPIFTSAIYDFETNTSPQWGPIKFIGNIASSINAQITTNNYRSGTKCLRTRRSGKAELTIDLTGVTNAVLSFFVKAINYDTYVWIKPPGSTNWYQAKLERKTAYTQYTFSLPGPHDSIASTHYAIRFGCNNNSLNYSYFDDVIVTNVDASKIAASTKLTLLE